MQYVSGNTLVEATRWFKNGDHPEDFSGFMRESALTMGMEGLVVRRFNLSGMTGPGPCCGSFSNEHGWIDEGGPGLTVCPGSYVLTVETTNGRKHLPMSPLVFDLIYTPLEGSVGTAYIKYQACLAALLARRHLSGGLTPELEEKYNDELDTLWNAMTSEERQCPTVTTGGGFT